MSGRSKRARKPTARVDSDASNDRWTDKELGEFYSAYKRYGEDWTNVVRAVSNHSTSDIQKIFQKHKTILTQASSMDPKMFISFYKDTHTREVEAQKKIDRAKAQAASKARAKAQKAAFEREKEAAKTKARLIAQAKAAHEAAYGQYGAPPLPANGGGGVKRVRNSPAKPLSPPAGVDRQRKRSRKLFAGSPRGVGLERRRKPASVRRIAVLPEAAGFYATGRAGVTVLPPEPGAPAGADDAKPMEEDQPAATAAGGEAAQAPTSSPTEAAAAAAAGQEGEAAAAAGEAEQPQPQPTSRRQLRAGLSGKEMHWCVYDAFYSGLDQVRPFTFLPAASWAHSSAVLPPAVLHAVRVPGVSGEDGPTAIV